MLKPISSRNEQTVCKPVSSSIRSGIKALDITTALNMFQCQTFQQAHRCVYAVGLFSFSAFYCCKCLCCFWEGSRCWRPTSAELCKASARGSAMGRNGLAPGSAQVELGAVKPCSSLGTQRNPACSQKGHSIAS